MIRSGNHRFATQSIRFNRSQALILVMAASALVVAACSGNDTSLKGRSAVRAPAKPGCIDLNSASVSQLEALPGIGEALSKRIVEFRERHGPFRRPEEIIIIDGISEQKFRAIADLVCIGGAAN